MQVNRLKRTDWRALDCFRVAGRLQHITRAAEQLGTSQPTLSRTLARLESDLKIPLFIRANRAVRLTVQGEKLLQALEQTQGELDQVLSQLSGLTTTSDGLVSIGFLPTLATRYIPTLVGSFRFKYPNVKFNLFQGNGTAIQDKLVSRELDFIFCGQPSTPSGFTWTRLLDQDFFLVVPRLHKLVGRKRVRLRDFASEAFITFKKGHAGRAFTDAACGMEGFAPRTSFETEDTSCIPGFVAAGCGVAIMAADTQLLPETVGLHLTHPILRRQIGMAEVERRYVSPSAKAFRDFTLQTHEISSS